jgi:hypothetical protein
MCRLKLPMVQESLFKLFIVKIVVSYIGLWKTSKGKNMNDESLNFENTLVGDEIMLIDVAPGDLIYEIDTTLGIKNMMLGKVERIGFSDNRYELFVRVYDCTNKAKIGSLEYLFHLKGMSHYGPDLYTVVIDKKL